MMKKILRIYSCTHCHPVIVQNKFIIPFQLRKQITGLDFGYLSDDTGDNISDRGVLYGGSLPSFYWVWKNDHKSDYVGFCHYRRYFLLDEKYNYFQIEYITTEEGLKQISFNERYIRNILEHYDVVLSKKRRFVRSVWKVYSKMHDERDLIALKEVIKKIYPQYLPIFNRYIEHGNLLPQFSMLITRKEIFDDFCKWLFPIIYRLDEMKDPKNNSLSKPRQIDFITEHLMPLYFIMHKELKIKYLSIVVADLSKKKKSNLRYFCSQIKTELRFLLNI